MEYIDLFYQLMSHDENEVVEFKEAKSSYSTEDLGKYFSALSNEARLRNQDFGWIVFGVCDKTHEVCGTSFKDSEKLLNELKHDMSQHTTDSLIFRDIIQLDIEGKRVLLFKVPATPRNIVMKWKGIAYGRDGESLKPLNQAKQDEIRHQSPEPDWSAEVLPNASILDLDELALATARVMYKKVHQSHISAEEVDAWTTEEFLAHSGIMIDGKLTRAAILLLGKPLSISYIRPAIAQITWTLQDKNEIVLDYEHFSIPFLLNVDKVLGKIRNMTMRELPGGTLFPDTMKQYDDYSIREALHNCIAHQDYTLEQRITVVEGPSSLYYGNGGSFIPGTIEQALDYKGPQKHYRNQCLCTGMVHFNMIDTVGRGIKKIFTEQQRRYFPMPDYEIDVDHKSVGVTIYGQMLDERYTTLLKSHNDITLKECVWLDAIQKNREITDDAIKHLKSKKLIEGRKPNYIIAVHIAQQTHQLADYTRKKGVEEEAIKQVILQLLRNANGEPIKLNEILATVDSMLPIIFSHAKKQRRVQHLLKKMSEDKLIESVEKKWRPLKY